LIYNKAASRFRSPAKSGDQHPSGTGGKDPIRDILACGQGTWAAMSDWIHNLPVPLMALAIFAFTYLLAIIVFAAVSTLAAGERAKSFQAISPGMLPVLGIIFGLFVAFTAAQVWNDNGPTRRLSSAFRRLTHLRRWPCSTAGSRCGLPLLTQS